MANNKGFIVRPFRQLAYRKFNGVCASRAELVSERGTLKVEGNRVSSIILFRTVKGGTMTQLEFEYQREGDILTLKRLSGAAALPPDYVDQWRKIG